MAYHPPSLFICRDLGLPKGRVAMSTESCNELYKLEPSEPAYQAQMYVVRPKEEVSCHWIIFVTPYEADTLCVSYAVDAVV